MLTATRNQRVNNVDMDLMKLFGTVIAVFFHPGSTASKLNGQRICRRGTERPCYKVSYIQDSRRRLTFEDARQACRQDGGDLLSIESDSEQRLIERFIQQLQAGDGDFWIGLRRSPQRHRAAGATSPPACPSQYYWLDGSRAKFRNWHWDEPSCGREMCAVLYHQPSAPPDEEGGHFLFHWNDDNCNAKNNYVCKYPEERLPVFTVAGNAVPVPSLRPRLPSTTESDERIKIGLLEPSVSLSDNSLRLSYVLYATIPVLLLLVLATAFFCYKRVAKRRKAETDSYPTATTEPWMLSTTTTTTTSGPPGPAAVQGPYAFSDITKLRHHSGGPPVGVMTAADIKRMTFCSASSSAHTAAAQCQGDYENVSSGTESESGFVTNDIYETCRQQQSRRQQQQQQHHRNHRHAGWVENEIYG